MGRYSEKTMNSILSSLEEHEYTPEKLQSMYDSGMLNSAIWAKNAH